MGFIALYQKCEVNHKRIAKKMFPNIVLCRYLMFPNIILPKILMFPNIFLLEVDYPNIDDVTLSTIRKTKKLLMLLAERVPQLPKMTELYKELETDRNQGLKMLNALERGGLLLLLGDNAKSPDNLSRPDKIYINNPTMMFALTPKVDMGTLRETFFINQLSQCHEVRYPAAGDFLVDRKYLFEVGGKGKTFDQIKDIENSYLAIDNTEIGHKNRIPLWMFGLLY